MHFDTKGNLSMTQVGLLRLALLHCNMCSLVESKALALQTKQSLVVIQSYAQIRNYVTREQRVVEVFN